MVFISFKNLFTQTFMTVHSLRNSYILFLSCISFECIDVFREKQSSIISHLLLPHFSSYHFCLNVFFIWHYLFLLLLYICPVLLLFCHPFPLTAPLIFPGSVPQPFNVTILFHLDPHLLINFTIILLYPIFPLLMLPCYFLPVLHYVYWPYPIFPYWTVMIFIFLCCVVTKIYVSFLSITVFF